MHTAVLIIAAVMATAAAASAQDAGSPKILVAYFSHTNNTRAIAEQIQANVGGDLFHVAPKNPYPSDYRAVVDVAKKEQAENQRPELAQTIPPEQMKNYDVIFIGYPNWWGTIPMPLFTFLEQYDLSGKTVIPFCTHEGSGLGRGPSDIRSLCPNSTLLDGLAIRGGSARSEQAKTDVAAWLRKIGVAR